MFIIVKKAGRQLLLTVGYERSGQVSSLAGCNDG